MELAFEDGSRLVAMLHPLHGYILELGADAPASGVEGKALRVGRLSLVDARAPADERALLLTFGDRAGRPWEMLAIELQDRRWNAVHCRRAESGTDARPAWRIEAALLARDAGDRSLLRGGPYAPPSSARRAVAAPPSEADWDAVLAGDEGERRGAVLRTWAWTSALNVDWILAGSDPAETYARYRALHALAAAPSGGPAAADAPGAPPRPAFVLDRPSGPQPYPHPAGAGSGSAAGLLTAAAHLLAPGAVCFSQRLAPEP
ncbi:MAG: hypothetical protein F4X67_14710 [Gemmatimonadales bacterium]|nr:hypothetical protein [Gemmatimonadales bacterium]